ncbi:ChbG/HpnK family deacetylase [Paenibacillus sp. LS1]|uniref:carbohydrate deacetylase n=1 Tax=Paenibacillus sp. LS1 TaxID=2992120 RepID=UPI00223026DA|nr:ChbG/HpnK family deacetylase [Paenibacillus sp. LS1]MCW3794802.1 ChbG/HpnK family deacetylase [Paenibacillus sp. LS1]
MSRQVIINADDFGLSPAINEGIIKAYQAGGITSTSMMVNMPGFDHAVYFARSLPELGIGLHFNLTYGCPLSNPDTVPSLVKQDGSFHNGNSVFVRDPVDISKELDAQWNRFIETSRFPAHLDSHHLLHQNDPMIYQIMADKAIRENVPLRKSQIVHSIPHAPIPRMTETILLDTYGDNEGLQRLLHHLFTLQEGTTEIVCHPGYVDDILRGISKWTDIRERELAVFISEEIPRTMQAMNILPINYTALKKIPEESCELPTLPSVSQPKHKKTSRHIPHRAVKRKRKTHQLFHKRGTKSRLSSTRTRKRL